MNNLNHAQSFFCFSNFFRSLSIKALFNKYTIIGALTLGIGVPGSAALADTVDFTDNVSAIVPSLTEGGVTVSGSDDIAVSNGNGIGIIGGVAPSLDPGETMTFTFDTPVESVSISNFQTNDTDGGGLLLEATFEALDESNVSLGSVTTTIDPSLSIDVSDILGVGSFSRFDITMVQDGLRIGNLNFTPATAADDIDLSISDIMTCEAPVEDQPCTVRVDIVNNGDTALTASVAEPVEVDLFSPQGGLDEFMALPPGTELAANGGTASTIFSWVPEDGQTQLSAVVDSQNLIAESNEGNNNLTISVVVTKPLNIPTLGEWGMIGMAGGLLLLCIFYARRKKDIMQ